MTVGSARDLRAEEEPESALLHRLQLLEEQIRREGDAGVQSHAQVDECDLRAEGGERRDAHAQGVVGRNVMFVKGAPENVLARCTSVCSEVGV